MTDAVVAVLNEVTDVYDEVVPFFATFAETTIDAAAPAPDDRVLDVGAGRGALAGRRAPRRDRHRRGRGPTHGRRIRANGCARHAVVLDAHWLGFADRSFGSSCA